MRGSLLVFPHLFHFKRSLALGSVPPSITGRTYVEVSWDLWAWYCEQFVSGLLDMVKKRFLYCFLHDGYQNCLKICYSWWNIIYVLILPNNDPARERRRPKSHGSFQRFYISQGQMISSIRLAVTIKSLPISWHICKIWLYESQVVNYTLQGFLCRPVNRLFVGGYSRSICLREGSDVM